jgi:hypothetical protein
MEIMLMNWYKRQLKFAASPKNIIENWKVADPFLKFFIYTYEPIIDIKRLAEISKISGKRSEDDINTLIQNDLIPALKEKINPNSKESYFKKTMSDEEVLAEIAEHPMDPRYTQAKQIFLNNPQAARNTILKAINVDKAASFDQWWNFGSENFMDFKQNPDSFSPSFFYSLLNPMIESSPSEQKIGPPPVHKEAVNHIKDEIKNKGVTQMQVFKKFNKISYDLDKQSSAKNAQNIDENKSWIKVESQIHDKTNYESNKEKLKRFATGTGWCIAGDSMANTYLSKGDFWLYFENKIAKVAIRLEGESHVAEVRGRNNDQKQLNPYWEQVINFLQKTNWDYKKCAQYEELEKIMFANVDLDTHPDAYNKMLEAIRQDPKQIGLVSEKNKQSKSFEGLARAAAAGFERSINTLLSAIEQIDSSGSEYQKRFSKFQDEYASIPPEVKPYMSKDIEARLIAAHRQAYMRNPVEFENFPAEIQAVITPQEKMQSWDNYIKVDPYRYNDLRMPSEVRKQIPKEAVAQEWIELIDRNIKHVDNIPAFLFKYFPEGYNINQKIIDDFKKYPCNMDKFGYDKLKRIQKKQLMTEEEIQQAYNEAVNKNPLAINWVPAQYKLIARKNITNVAPLAEDRINEILGNAEYFNTIQDQDVKNWLLSNRKPQLIESFIRLQKRYGRNLDSWWREVPVELQNDMANAVMDQMVSYYAVMAQQSYSFIDRVPLVFKQNVLNKISTSRMNWYKLAKGF